MKFGPAKTLQVVQQAMALIKAGQPAATVARRFKVSPQWLNYHFHKAGYFRGQRPESYGPDHIAKARELRAQGMRWKLIERELGIKWELLAHTIHRQDRENKS